EKKLPRKASRQRYIIITGILITTLVLLFLIQFTRKEKPAALFSPAQPSSAPSTQNYHPTEKWLQRAYLIDELFHYVYTPCWEGAYGAIGDAYLFAATHDSSLFRFHLIDHDLRRMCTGTWVDDCAWICLAECTWWNVTGRNHSELVDDARHRYLEARTEGRLSNHEGFWSWYNWPPNARATQRVFTNSNMNQMVTIACWLYDATGDKTFLSDALLVWNGDSKYPGIEKILYKGNGKWEGRPGQAAFGKQVPWDGVDYASIAAALYRVTKDPKYKTIVVATTKRVMDPALGWVDPHYFYQVRMDGNGAFVNFLLDAYASAPEELSDLLPKIELMLDHVWTNSDGAASVTLHRERDHGIRNGWNPHGGEDGYGVDEVGTVHAQGEAVRAFGTFAYYINARTASPPPQSTP
ncbi:MAG: hypothetical protein HY033_06365, partial [Ignavibacteriae bacterium]|nr:hypothetical protein [Ignavibacteriota bacterium]